VVDFPLTRKEFCGTMNVSVFRISPTWRIWLWRKHKIPPTLFTQAEPKCTKIWRTPFVGTGWSATSLSLSPDVISVKRLRQNTNAPLDFSILCKF
jgi:hypothetical protein